MTTECQSINEIDSLLLSAARHGDVISLKTLLSSITNPDTYLNRVYKESEKHACTLLMIPCLNEDEDMVRILLTSFKFNLEMLNVVEISVKDQNLKVYENVTVLWTAAALNNFEIIKLLVEHGAQVNHTIKTNSTPLRCVCFHGNVNMARYLIEHGADINIRKEHNDTNLILSVFREHIQLVHYLVDELRCDVNECDDENRSPLYLAVERGSLELVQFLISRGARNFPTLCDQMSPLLLAADQRRKDLVDVIFPQCSLLEQIEAEELLGSAFACKEYGTCDLEKSFEHFSRALKLRSTYHLAKTLRKSTHEVFNHRQECQTIDQLEELHLNPDNLYIEALLIRERLLGSIHPKYRHALLHRGATLANTAQYQQGIALWMYQLELYRQHSLPIYSKQLRYFVKTFAAIVYKWSSIPIQNLCQVITVIINELDHNIKEFDYNLYTLLFLITITSQILTNTLSIGAEHKEFYRLIYSINQKRYVTHHDGSSLLHLCLSEHTFSSDSSIDRICKYPCLQIVRTLLQCGADVNSSNAKQNTPLHIFVSDSLHNDEIILQLLYNANAHLDYANAFMETPMDLALDPKIKQFLKVKMQLSLKCLCARLIQKTDIQFHGKIAKSLVTFVERH